MGAWPFPARRVVGRMIVVGNCWIYFVLLLVRLRRLSSRRGSVLFLVLGEHGGRGRLLHSILCNRGIPCSGGGKVRCGVLLFFCYGRSLLLGVRISRELDEKSLYSFCSRGLNVSVFFSPLLLNIALTCTF